MASGIAERRRHWRLPELLRDYPTLRLAPASDSEYPLVLSGRMPFRVKGPDGRVISDQYKIKLSIPDDFPKSVPLVIETERRIPRSHHKLEGNHLCLAAPTEQRLILAQDPTLIGFVRSLLLPYLYSYSYYEQHGEMPYGEEEHGDQGIRDHLGRLYHAPAIEGVEEFLRLTALRKRSANKLQCPCGSGLRLGRCHNRSVNSRRRQLGRGWYKEEYSLVLQQLDRKVERKHRRLTKPPTLREQLTASNAFAYRSGDRAKQTQPSTNTTPSLSFNSAPLALASPTLGVISILADQAFRSSHREHPSLVLQETLKDDKTC